ncbi:putative serine esterase-domain-containing protein [Pyronema omphalodes]|nr:putative serine esterase-domain-containing protein [Pyronema omphalodes]
MLLLHTTGITKIGEVRRYTITYTPSSDRILPLPTQLHLRIKNTAPLPFRAAYLHGPYTLYVSVRRAEFQPWKSATEGTNERDEELGRREDREPDNGAEGTGATESGEPWSPGGRRAEIAERAERLAQASKNPDEEREKEGLVPLYEPHLKAGASFYATLPIPGSLLSNRSQRRDYEHGGRVSLDGTRQFDPPNSTERKSVTWIVEIISQTIFSPTATVGYELLLGRDEKSLGFSVSGDVCSRAITVRLEGNKDLWNRPAFPGEDSGGATGEEEAEVQEELRRAAGQKRKKVHLVVLTHGLHSNTGADMLFLKEAIDEEARKATLARRARRQKEYEEGKITKNQLEALNNDDEQVIVRGFHDNHCRTERGIKYLGKRLAKYILHLASPNTNPLPHPGKLQKRPHHLLTPAAEPKNYRITSISFLGHSLGGLVQTYAIAYIHAHAPTFFTDVKPINFVAFATPFLGLSNENPLYVRFALDFGLVGRTGQDLGLTWKAPGPFSGWGNKNSVKTETSSSKPLLRILPSGPAHEVLKKFRRRTVYANVVNDGIVPLRTSCLLFLDWKGLGKVEKARRENMVGGLVEWGWGQLVESGVRPAGISAGRVEGATGLGSKLTSPISPTFSLPMSPTFSLPSFGTALWNKNNNTNVKALPPTPPNGVAVGEASRSGQSAIQGQAETEFPPTIPVALTKPPALNPFSGLMTLLRPTPKLTPAKNNQHLQRILTDSQTATPSSSTTSLIGVGSSSNAEGSVSGAGTDAGTGITAAPSPPPRTTLLEAAGDLLNPPLPPSTYLTDESSRPECIFHDRVYESSDIPPAKSDSISVEEKIARAWHKDMSWRKVLVSIQPDAHNNVIVRRGFANAYGWGVVKHSVEAHFSLEADDLLPIQSNQSSRSVSPSDPTDMMQAQRPVASAPEDPDERQFLIGNLGRGRSETLDSTASWGSSAFLSSSASSSSDEAGTAPDIDRFLDLPSPGGGLVEVSKVSAEARRSGEGTRVGLGLGLRNLSFGSSAVGGIGGWGERRDEAGSERPSSEAMRALERVKRNSGGSNGHSRTSSMTPSMERTNSEATILPQREETAGLLEAQRRDAIEADLQGAREAVEAVQRQAVGDERREREQQAQIEGQMLELGLGGSTPKMDNNAGSLRREE